MSVESQQLYLYQRLRQNLVVSFHKCLWQIMLFSAAEIFQKRSYSALFVLEDEVVNRDRASILRPTETHECLDISIVLPRFFTP
jgi:hypothetical protein